MTVPTRKDDQPRKRRRWRRLLLLLLICCTSLGWWHTHKPLPPGLHVDAVAQPVAARDLRLLTDVTYVDRRGSRIRRQEIFDATLRLIADSHDLLVLDYFLFNEQGGPAGELDYAQGLRPLARQLRQALLERHRADPGMPIVLLVDPINSYYGSELPPELAELRAAGIEVLSTDLDPLRDSNPLYSSLWRLGLGWWLTPSAHGWLPNILDRGGPGLSAGAVARLLNFKANHRKVVITGDGQGSLRGIVASANPHDASSAHSNVALLFAGPALLPLLRSELDIARMSGWHGQLPIPSAPAQAADVDAANAAVVTEGAIRERLLRQLDGSGAGQTIDIAMFYLSERSVADALVAAAARGARVRLILDPNKDAFGFEKSGLPNRPLAFELRRRSKGGIAIRWYKTHGEQFHSKIAAISDPHHLWLMLGSANFTRRNLEDYNLEADVIVEESAQGELSHAFHRWFEDLWSEEAPYTAPFEAYADGSQAQYWLYRVMEASGLSTF